MDIKRLVSNPKNGSNKIRKWITVSISLALAVGLWKLIIVLGDFPAFILPSPIRVFSRFWQALEDGSLIYHTWVTLQEVLAGLMIGGLLATILGYFLAKSPVLEQFATPYIVASQSVPTVAIAPLIIIWFGSGMISKVLICALIVLFPILTNTIVGVRSVSEELYDLMRSLKASNWQIFRLLETPASLSVFLGGLRIGATLSVIGAVVGEFVGADKGLGFLINVGRGEYDTSLVFVAVFLLVVMAMTLYMIVTILEKQLLQWKEDN